MTHDSSQPSEALLRRISQDLQPVKPAPLPSRLAFRLAPFALVIASTILVIVGLRRDSAVLGPLLTWGASLAQFALSILLIWMAARESTPARRLPKKIIWLAAAVSFMAVAATALWTFSVSPTVVSPRVSPWFMGVACGVGATIAGTLLVVLFGWVFRHSLAARPVFAGALYGAGAGIAVNAGWRLACPVSTPSHAIGAHGAAVVLTTLLGMLAAQCMSRRGIGLAGAGPLPD